MEDEEIIKWVSLKYLPFNFFDDEHTQTFFKNLNSTIAFPKRTALREKAVKTFTLTQKKVLEILKKNESKISFTIDGWTSINYKSYYGITAHFIDKHWNIQSIVLDFLPSHGHHTGKDIASVFYSCLQEYELIDKIQGITVDNAAANTTFIKELENLLRENYLDHPFNSEDAHFRCFAHIINLGVQDTLKLLKLEHEEVEGIDESDNEDRMDENIENLELSPINKIRFLFKKIKKSEQKQNLLKTLCEAANLKYISVNIDVSTRWNSTCDMLVVAIKLKRALINLCQTNEEFIHLLLTEDQWILVNLVCKFFKYFKSLSTTLCGETYSTLPLVIVGFNILLDKLEHFLLDLNTKVEENVVNSVLIEAFQAGRDKMLKHYVKTNWIYCAALVLDPRHKIQTFNLTSWGKEIKEGSLKKTESIFYKSYSNTSLHVTEPEQNKDSSSSDEFLSILYKKTDTDRNDNNIDLLKDEFERFVGGDRASRETDILKWWKDHETVFPHLAIMARDILAIPATSVPAERLFSKAGLIIRKHRNRLNAESARTLLCLNSWYSCRLSEELFGSR